VACM